MPLPQRASPEQLCRASCGNYHLWVTQQAHSGVMTTIGLAPKLNLLLKLGPDNFPAVSSTRTVKLAVTGERSKVDLSC